MGAVKPCGRFIDGKRLDLFVLQLERGRGRPRVLNAIVIEEEIPTILGNPAFFEPPPVGVFVILDIDEVFFVLLNTILIDCIYCHIIFYLFVKN
jgi:hypothetical protein